MKLFVFAAVIAAGSAAKLGDSSEELTIRLPAPTTEAPASTEATTHAPPPTTRSPYAPVFFDDLQYQPPQPRGYQPPQPFGYQQPQPLSYQPPQPVSYQPPQPVSYQPPQPVSYQPPQPVSYQPPQQPKVLAYQEPEKASYEKPELVGYQPSQPISYQPPQLTGYQQPQPITYRQQPITYKQPAYQPPVVTRNLYLYNAPEQKVHFGPAPPLPPKKVHYNFVFVRTASGKNAVRPIVAPAPEQKTLVYLLNKKPGYGEQEVIEVPHTPTKPEVFFVSYKDGQNAYLPGGIDLKTALSQSIQQGEVVEGPSGYNAYAPLSSPSSQYTHPVAVEPRSSAEH